MVRDKNKQVQSWILLLLPLFQHRWYVDQNSEARANRFKFVHAAGQKDNQPSILTFTHTSNLELPVHRMCMFELGPWEEGGAPGENPRRHKENVQTHRERPKLELNPQLSCFFLSSSQEPSLWAVSYMDTWNKCNGFEKCLIWRTRWSKTYIKFRPKAKCKLTKSKIEKPSQKYRENGHKHWSGDQGP